MHKCIAWHIIPAHLLHLIRLHMECCIVVPHAPPSLPHVEPTCSSGCFTLSFHSIPAGVCLSCCWGPSVCTPVIGCTPHLYTRIAVCHGDVCGGVLGRSMRWCVCACLMHTKGFRVRKHNKRVYLVFISPTSSSSNNVLFPPHTAPTKFMCSSSSLPLSYP